MNRTRVCAHPKCPHGGAELPLTDEFWNRDASTPGGFSYRCRLCKRRDSKARREKNKAANPSMRPPFGAARAPAAPPPAQVAAGSSPPVPPPQPIQAIEEEEITVVEEHRLKRRIADLESRIKALTEDLSHHDAVAELHEAAARTRREQPTIEPRERASGLREATALVLASDWHVEEVVLPEQVSGRNRYNLEISKRRAARFFERARASTEFNRQWFLIRDTLLWLGGDFITNFLHDDNRETNLLGPPQALFRAQNYISDGIRFLLQDEKTERIVVCCNDGNHGRMSEKQRVAARQKLSMEWLLYSELALEFSDEPRVKFVVFDGLLLYQEVYGRTIRFTHGDSVNYGGGIGGVTIPLYKAHAAWQTERHADLTVLGHFHQHISLRDIIVNGSLIGHSPYAVKIKARYEEPCQDFTILDSKRWKSVSIPLWVADRSDDSAAT